MSDTHTYWISLGRNVPPGRPMMLGDWHDFQNATEAVIRDHAGTIVTEVGGRGGWEGETEETHLFLVTVRPPEVRLLRTGLAALARRYGQEAIGFVGGPGTDTLIRP